MEYFYALENSILL